MSAVTVAAGATEEHTVTWPTPFDDTSYAAVATIKTTEGTLGASLTLNRISALTTTGITVSITNDDGVSALSGDVHAIGLA